MTIVGYARVSTADQTTDPQESALRSAGAVRVFSDVASGAKAARPQLAAALGYLNPGDTLAVWKLDRLGRSLPHLIETVQQLNAHGIEFRSLTEEINTTTTHGRFFFHISGAFAEFERDLIRERTNAGLASARAQGRIGGRPTAMTADKLAAATAVIENGGTRAAAAAAISVSLRTLTRALASTRP